MTGLAGHRRTLSGLRVPEQSEAGFSGVVLAGGRSQRLGTDKAFLPLFDQPLIARVVYTLAGLSDDLIVVTNTPAPYAALGLPVRLVGDEQPGQGSLMGVYTGLRQARHPHALVVACDMPFLCLSLLRYMTTLMAGYDVVVPEVNGLLEPLHAIYGEGSLPPMARLLAGGERKIIRFFPEVRVRVVKESEIDRLDPDHLSFLNVNTRQDWDRIQQMLSTGNCFPR